MLLSCCSTAILLLCKLQILLLLSLLQVITNTKELLGHGDNATSLAFLQVIFSRSYLFSGYLSWRILLLLLLLLLLLVALLFLLSADSSLQNSQSDQVLTL